VSPFFRIPGLLRQKSVEQYLAAHGDMTWSADFLADDWTRINNSEVARRAISRIEARGKGILLLHDIHPPHCPRAARNSPPPATRVIPARHVSHADTVKTGMSKARVRGPCVVTGRLTGAPYSVSVTALEAPEVRRPLRGPLGRKAAIAASRVVA
jgi:hypothetical protein